MNHVTRSIALAGLVGSLGLVACDNANTSRSDAEAATPADRSAPRANEMTTPPRTTPRDSETTAVNQSNASEHIDITARIRRAVMDDDGLSTRAKNVTIVTDDTGTVTLRGEVESQAEKDAIAAKATAVVGAEHVINRLVINP